MNSSSKIASSIRLFRTAPHSCSYKSAQEAATVFVDPELIIDKRVNSKLTDLGFRRSGGHLYRPDCDNCSACISCRVPVELFKPNRRFRRILNSNKDLEVVSRTNLTEIDAYPLYKRYINTRHSDGDMYPATPEQYQAFIGKQTDHTRYLSFHLEGEIVAVAVVDQLEHGLSAVYTFFEPSLAKRSLGMFAILWQIEHCRSEGLPYLYLGYWIKDCEKMEYKSTFRPLQLLLERKWLLLR
jgi:arginyl-tRNA--protein-N-Asp/Glu arginylyltransferase